MIELKLSVAAEEGQSQARPHCPHAMSMEAERLMPGLELLHVPVNNTEAHFVFLTDDYDQQMLGFPIGDKTSVLLIHENDLAAFAAQGMPLSLDDRFEQKSALAGWWFRPCPWNDRDNLLAALRGILPGLAVA
jgi:hypothetical protein